MSDLVNFVNKYDDVNKRSRDISKTGVQNFFPRIMDYAHAKFQGSRIFRTETTEGGQISSLVFLEHQIS